MEATDTEAREVARRHLHGDERLAWVGRPEPGLRFTRSDWFLIPFSVFWVGFVILWAGAALAGAIGSGDAVAWFFPLFAIPFLIVGYLLTIGRFRLRAAQRRRLVYAVTDRRVMAIERGAVDNVRSVFLQGLPGVGEHIGRDGVGTLSFEPIPPMWAMYAGSGLEWMIGGIAALPLQFFDIRDAPHVAALIAEQRGAAMNR